MMCVCVSSADIKRRRWRNSWETSQTSTCSLSSELLFIASHSSVFVELIVHLLGVTSLFLGLITWTNYSFGVDSQAEKMNLVHNQKEIYTYFDNQWNVSHLLGKNKIFCHLKEKCFPFVNVTCELFVIVSMPSSQSEGFMAIIHKINLD